MKNKPSKPTASSLRPSSLIKRIFAVVVIVWLLVLTVLYASLLSLYNDGFTNTERVLQKQYYEIYKTNFCTENAIKPCDDIGLTQWNESHGDDQKFTILH